MRSPRDRWFLHLSDFHIAEPDGDKQFLRKNHYEEFVEKFSIKVLHSITTDSLSGVFFTGDLLDRGNLSCLPHAQNVLSLLWDKLDVNKDIVVACHGNHDFNRKEANRGYSKAIFPVSNLLNTYGVLVDDCQNPLGSLYALGQRTFVLKLDSMLDPKKGQAGYPGEPANSQVDSVFDMVRDNVKDGDCLIVMSHHPLSDFAEINQMETRIWSGGRLLGNRLSEFRARASSASIWLSGDFHIPMKPRPFGIFTCLLGCHFDNRPRGSVQLPGAVLFKFREGSTTVESVIIRLEQFSHKLQPSGGEWQRQEKTKFTPTLDTKSLPVRVTKPARKKIHTAGGGALVEVVEDPRAAVTGGAPTLEDKICATIAREHLYHIGRFEISETQISLGWVSIGPLLSGTPQRGPGFSAITPLFPLTVLHMKNWLWKKLENETPRRRESVLLLGIDSWGAVLASQLSLMLGFRNFCVAGRGAGIHHTPFERVTSRVRAEARTATRVVLITDVIATGRTLRSVYETVTKDWPKKARDKKWLAMAVLADEQTHRGKTLDFVDVIGCACKTLRIPLISPTKLPDVKVLPATLKFARESIR